MYLHKGQACLRSNSIYDNKCATRYLDLRRKHEGSHAARNALHIKFSKDGTPPAVQSQHVKTLEGQSTDTPLKASLDGWLCEFLDSNQGRV